MEIKKDYIRITELLKPWQNWGTIPQEILDAKAEIGTNVHEAINMHALGLPIPNLSEREQKYFESYLRWDESHEPTFECAEQRYYDDELKITGQIDAVITFPDKDGSRIVDFKTSAQPNFLHWHIQLGWYYLLAKKNGLKVSDTTFVLQLKDNGSLAKQHSFIISDDIIDICKSIYKSYVYFNPVKNQIHDSSWCC